MEEQWESETEAQEYNKLCIDIVKDPKGDYLKILRDHVSFADGCKVLDLGCGTGNITLKLAEKVGAKGQVIGIDPDKARIQVARENNTQLNLTFLVGDADHLPQDEFDVVFCNYVMGSIENKRSVFENVAKVIPPGGKFVVVAILRHPEITFELARLMGPKKEDLINQMWFHTSDTVYDDLALATGFTVTVKQKEDACFSFTVDSLKNSWLGITHGRFDPALADQTALKEFEKKYADQMVEWRMPIARYVLTKN